MLNVGRKLQTSVAKRPTQKHGNTGKKGMLNNHGKIYTDIYNSLHSFSIKLKNEWLPFATRIIHKKPGMMTRDDDPTEISLAPHLTKCQLYAK